MKHQWNTGRRYDTHGQRMVAEVEEEHILFTDHSRHINGKIPLGNYLKGRQVDKVTIEALVMANYDCGNYSGSFRSIDLEGELK